ncbi:MAG: hypothetical protein FWG61_07880 [Firmicutes bacterium]|nr:hypothetical protein [Bacillota bacterium]
MDSNLLNDRIGRLKEWEQKESINEILFNALSSLSSYTEERFDTLTQEIRDEALPNIEAPLIKVAVCKEENAESLLFLHPVSLKPPLDCPDYLTTVFCESDYLTIQELMKQTLTAEITDKKSTRKILVKLRYSMKYLQKLQALYYTFNENELPWSTVNGQYFYKFLDVYSLEEPALELKEIKIDFAACEKYISYDKMLMWNIALVNAPVAACEPKPAYNAILYEHVLKKLELDEYKYLVCPMGDRFSVYRKERELYVRTYAKQLEAIDLLRIIINEDVESPLYLPLKSNQKKPGLLNTLAKSSYIPSWGEAERIIHSLNLGNNLRLRDIKVLPYKLNSVKQYEGIDYNFFVETNSLLVDKKLLLFSFNIDIDEMWAYETMFYALSELQLYFYEYRCVGEII